MSDSVLITLLICATVLALSLLHSVIDARLDLPCGNRSCFRDGFQQFFIRRFIVWIHQNRHLSMQL